MQYRNYVEYTGRLIGGHFSIETNYAKTEYDEYGKPFAPDLIVNKNSDTSLYYWAYALYISALSYFIVSTWYLSKRIKYLTDKIVKDENKS